MLKCYVSRSALHHVPQSQPYDFRSLHLNLRTHYLDTLLVYNYPRLQHIKEKEKRILSFQTTLPKHTPLLLKSPLILKAILFLHRNLPSTHTISPRTYFPRIIAQDSGSISFPYRADIRSCVFVEDRLVLEESG